MDQTTLSFLVITDIHESTQNVQKISQKFQDKKIDFVLILGDILSIPENENINDNNFNQLKIQQIAAILEPLHKWQCYFIPGNHDPYLLFKGEEISEHVKNIHQKRVQLKQDLQLVGFGGSIPAYQGNEKVWEGYPFKNEEDYENALQEIRDLNQQTILISHIGPKLSSTSEVRYGLSDVIVTGSEQLNKYLVDKGDLIVINIHGHTHGSYGWTQFKNSSVLNPGALVDGRYGYIEVEKQQKWEVKDILFGKL